jgi:hypothetical protein
MRLAGDPEPWIGHGPRSWSPDEAVASNSMSSKTSDIEISERTARKSTLGQFCAPDRRRRTPLARNQAGKEKRNPYSSAFQLRRARAPLVGQSTTSCRRFNPLGIRPTDSAQEPELSSARRAEAMAWSAPLRGADQRRHRRLSQGERGRGGSGVSSGSAA